MAFNIFSILLLLEVLNIFNAILLWPIQSDFNENFGKAFDGTGEIQNKVIYKMVNRTKISKRSKF